LLFPSLGYLWCVKAALSVEPAVDFRCGVANPITDSAVKLSATSPTLGLGRDEDGSGDRLAGNSVPLEPCHLSMFLLSADVRETDNMKQPFGGESKHYDD